VNPGRLGSNKIRIPGGKLLVKPDHHAPRVMDVTWRIKKIAVLGSAW